MLLSKETDMTYNWDKEQFIKDYDELKSSRKMAIKYNVSHKTILSFAKHIGYKATNRRLVLTDEMKHYLITQYSYKSATELSKELNISTDTISTFWHREGLRGKSSRVYQYNEQYFHIIDSADKAYWIGFLAADGCIHRTKDSRQDMIIIVLEDSDTELLEKLNCCLQCNKPLRHFIKPNGKTYVRFEISSDIMSKDLAQYGIVPQKTYKYIFPDNINKEYYRDFIRGFFDGDGTISKSIEQNTLYKTNIGFTGYAKNLKRIQEVLQEQDISSTFIEDKREYNSKDIFGFLALTSKIDKVKFLHYVYDDAQLYLQRKYILAQRFIELVSTGKKCWKLRE